ncbi:MAG: hypothetical protein DRO90_02275 [Candidatus Altiarchaeales archaeon]|nr:MAG: hypothetical protein DRO95_04850 [Candidatus Altiarchaeales archaeon]RLI94292.1 MAG: hypothetical protein DRO90_02275 [Candidatus Altiarchaeales archaeon]RLI95609.1 MAG: hypothetical protein DRO94_00075 [Candidatus Altiarchaeales archaeon]HDO82061.1 hypothetical protein [Candidatus Altiarchaeales archaeon]HEX54710.1 hypothetical protein [Candidatus Altiarchaeales archaeon]
MNEYDFELDRIIGEIKKNNAKLIALQFPEGLKKYAVEIAEEIEKNTESMVIIFIDPVYGACDRMEIESKFLGIDLVFHFGHSI